MNGRWYLVTTAISITHLYGDITRTRCQLLISDVVDDSPVRVSCLEKQVYK